MGVCVVSDKKIFMIGGCITSNAYPCSYVFELYLRALTKPIKKKNMLLKRYGHSVVYNNGYIYSLGGFSHKDLPNEVPVTLSSCEKYNVSTDSWTYISSMNEARSFFGAVVID